MPKKMPGGWQQFEHDVQEVLGLDATICSGNKFNDIGDATDNRPPGDDSFRLLVDCKFTEHMSYSVVARKMRRWCETGTEKGKRSILALRFWPRGQQAPDDFVVMDFNDFVELLEKAKDRPSDRILSRPSDPVHPSTYTPSCPNEGNPCFCTGACLQKPGARTWASDRTYLERDEYKGMH